MKKDNIKELINYLIVGILTTIVSYGVYYLITISLLDPNNKIELQIANIISWICAVIFAYFTNRKYVFQSKEKNMLKEGSKFCLSRVFTLLLDMLTMFIMVSLLHINDRLSKLVSQVFITIGNYIISKFFVFNENKNNSKNLKVISNTLLIMLGSIIAGTILLVLVYIIPTNHMKENASDVVSVFEREGRYPEIIEGYANTKLDNYTDALIINEAIFDSDDNLIDKAMYVYSKQKKEPLTDVISVIQNEDNEMNNEGYGRYWHGNVIPVKLLLLIFSFSQIRVFNIFIQTILLLGIFYLMIKKNLISNTFSLAISIFLIFPFIIGLSLQYSSIYYIFLISTLIMLKYNNKLKDKYHYFFLIMGIVTNYFDFLTYPIFALGMGLIFKSMLNKKEKLKDSILTIIKYSVFFFLGYFGMWLGKWAIGSLLCHDNFFKLAMESAKVRSSGGLGERFIALARNIWVYHGRVTLIIVFSMIIYYIYHIIKEKKNIHKANILAGIPYIIIAFIPVVWILILGEHSYIHAFFVNKSLVVSLYSGLLFLDTIQNKKD